MTRNQKQPSYLASVADWWWARIVAAILWPLHVLGTKLVYSKIHSAIGISKVILFLLLFGLKSRVISMFFVVSASFCCNLTLKKCVSCEFQCDL